MHALINGTLHTAPEARIGKSGKGYVSAKLKADGGKDGVPIWVSLVAFNAQATELLALPAGAPLSVVGKLEARGYVDKAGQPAVGLSVVVDSVLTLAPRETKEPRPQHRDTRPQAAATSQSGMRDFAPAGFDDDLPFGDG